MTTAITTAPDATEITTEIAPDAHTGSASYSPYSLPEDLAKRFKAAGLRRLRFNQCNKSGHDLYMPHGVTWELIVTDSDGDSNLKNMTFDYINTSQNIRRQQIEQVLEWFEDVS